MLNAQINFKYHMTLVWDAFLIDYKTILEDEHWTNQLNRE